MMILKRKEIIAAALVVLIGMAGYLNWSYQDTIRVKDGDSYIETGKKLGEAQYVSSVTETEDTAEAWGKKDTAEPSASTSPEPNASSAPTPTSGTAYFETAKMEKQTSRASALEILNQTAANESFDSEIRKKAQEEILSLASLTEKETAVENIARAKGYDAICVFVNEDLATISVKKEGFSESDVVKLQEIACEQLKFSANNIKVVEVE